MADLSTPAHLRALVEALPAHAHGLWDYRARSVFMDGHDAGNVGVPGYPSVIANAHFAPGVGDYVTVVASPPVVLALADLFEAEDVCREADAAIASIPNGMDMELVAPIAEAAARAEINRKRAFDALEAAIHRTPPARAPEGQQG